MSRSALALALSAALAAPSAHAATIHFQVGGDFHVSPSNPDRMSINFTAGSTGDSHFVSRRLTQPPDGEFRVFGVDSTNLYFAVLVNTAFHDDPGHAIQFHFGPWLGVESNSYMGASEITMIGGPIIDLGGGKLAQRWTYLVDGVEQNVDVAMVPEPATWALAAAGLLPAWRRRV